MKSVIAYASTILGLTQLVGMLVGNIVSLPVAMAVPHHLKLRIVPLLEVFPGAAALVAAITLFWLLSVPVTIFVPLIVAGWLTFYFLAYYQSRVEWYASVAGVFICWIIYRTALLLLAPRVEGVAAVDVWQQLGGWFVTGLIASLFFTLLAMTRRKVQRRRNDREEPVKSKTDNTELTSSQDEPGEKARTGLQVMNGMFVLFCGYVFLTGRFVLSPIDWFVWILFNFGFIAAYVLAFLAAGNPKHDTKRKLAKWSNVSAVGLALLTLIASAAIGATGGLIGGIVVVLPAVINVWAFWKRSLVASPAHASTGHLIRLPLVRAVLVVGLVLLGLCVLLVILFLNKSSRSASNAKTSSVPDPIQTTPKVLPSPVAAVRSVIPQTPVSGKVSLKRDWLIRLPSGGTAFLPAGRHLELVSSDGSDIHVRFINGSLDEYVIPVWVTDFVPVASPSQISPEEAAKYLRQYFGQSDSPEPSP